KLSGAKRQQEEECEFSRLHFAPEDTEYAMVGRFCVRGNWRDSEHSPWRPASEGGRYKIEDDGSLASRTSFRYSSRAWLGDWALVTGEDWRSGLRRRLGFLLFCRR